MTSIGGSSTLPVLIRAASVRGEIRSRLGIENDPRDAARIVAISTASGVSRPMMPGTTQVFPRRLT